MYRSFIDGESFALSSTLAKAKLKLQAKAIAMFHGGCDRALKGSIQTNGKVVFETEYLPSLLQDYFGSDDIFEEEDDDTAKR